MSHNTDVRYVTALYDLNRAKDDGRTIQEYKKWLHQTLCQFPNTLVFHDSSLDFDFRNNFPSVMFHELHLTSLPLYLLKDDIRKISDRFSYTENRDLVYKNIDYGIVINSKFEFLRLASELVGEDNFLWIDAGISRFFSQSLPLGSFDASNLGDLSLLFDLRNFLRRCIFAKSVRLTSVAPMGSSQRIIGAVTMFVNRREVGSAANKYFALVRENIHMGFWDTEQIFLSRYICSNKVNLVFQIRSNHLQMLRYRSGFKRFFARQVEKCLVQIIR